MICVRKCHFVRIASRIKDWTAKKYGHTDEARGLAGLVASDARRDMPTPSD